MDRRNYILDKLKAEEKVSVKQLSAELGCSEPTIRTDIRRMEKEGLIRRIHGGAVLRDGVVSENRMLLDFPGLREHADEKRAIARAAYERIDDRDTIIIDDSSSAYFLAECIRNMHDRSIVVITNSVAVSIILARTPGVSVIQAGGLIDGRLPASMGELTIEQISKVRADKAFIGVYTLNLDQGVMSVGNPQMMVKKAIVSAAQKVYALVDHTKFGDSYLSVVCPLSDIECVITDSGVSKDIKARAEGLGVNLLVVGP